jgi:hypothetical protein
MAITNDDCELACRKHLERFFGVHPDAALQRRALKSLRFLLATEEPLLGKPAGWAAGIIYEVSTRDRHPCGVPGVLNRELEQCFGVFMGTIRKRAAQMGALLAL